MKTHVLLAVVLSMAPSVAHADEAMAIVIDATQIMPREDVHAGAVGGGAEFRVLPDDEPFTASFGTFVAIGQRGEPMRRDVLDVHATMGVKAKKKAFAPYVELGLHVLHVTTHRDEMAFRGTTLGVSAQAGVLGVLGKHTVFRANAGYLGAIAPGTGDDLGAVVLQVGLGYAFDD